MKSEIGFEKYFLNSLRILVRTLPEAINLLALSVPRMSPTSFFVVGYMKKEFSFEFFKHESKNFNIFGIFVTRLLVIDRKKLLIEIFFIFLEKGLIIFFFVML